MRFVLFLTVIGLCGLLLAPVASNVGRYIADLWRGALDKPPEGEPELDDTIDPAESPQVMWDEPRHAEELKDLEALADGSALTPMGAERLAALRAARDRATEGGGR